MNELKPMEVIMKIDFSASNGLEIVAHAEKVSELVRCRECIHDNLNDPICPIPWVKRMLDSFCSFGERRTK